MPEVNGSIPASVNVPQTDPFATIGKFVGVKQALLQNRMLQQDYAARQGAGQAYQQAIGPDGNLDSNKFASLIAADPRTAYNTGQYIKEAQERELQQANISSQQADAYTKHLNLVGGALSSLLSTNEPLTKDYVITHAANLLGNSALQPELRKGMQGDVVQLISQLTDDPAQNKAILTQLAVRNVDAQQRLQAVFGAPQAVNTGGQTQIVAPSAVTGQTAQLGTLTNTMSPGEASAPTPVMVRNPDGTISPSAVTRGQFNDMSQAGPVATAPPLTPQGLDPAQAQALVDVYDPATHQMHKVPRASLQMAPVGSGSAAGQGAGGPGAASGPPLGQPEAMATTGTESAKQGVQLQQQADAAPARRAALQSMRDQLVNITTGPAADKMAHLSALAREFGLPAPISKEGVKATEEFNKLSTQIVLQQVANLGGAGTDDKLAAGIKGNPSTYLSNLGNKTVTALMLGNEDAITAKNGAWQAWLNHGHGPETYGQFSTQFNGLYDPRVFQAQYMDPKDRAAMIKNMTAGQKQRYDSAVRVAVQAGWIKP